LLHDLIDEPAERFDAGGVLAAAEHRATVDVVGGQVGERAAAVVVVVDSGRADLAGWERGVAAAAGLDGGLLVGGDHVLGCAQRFCVPGSGVEVEHPLRLGGERKKYLARGRSCTKPGTLLKSQIQVRTWADWDDAVPGFVEIDLVSHDGGHAAGEHVWTLTSPTSPRAGPRTAACPPRTANAVMAALDDITAVMPFPIRGIDSDNGSEFINFHLLD
jgi:hypothetical protein